MKRCRSPSCSRADGMANRTPTASCRRYGRQYCGVTCRCPRTERGRTKLAPTQANNGPCDRLAAARGGGAKARRRRLSGVGCGFVDRAEGANLVATAPINSEAIRDRAFTKSEPTAEDVVVARGEVAANSQTLERACGRVG